MHSGGNQACITYNVEFIIQLTMSFCLHATRITSFEGQGGGTVRIQNFLTYFLKSRLSLVSACTRLFWGKYVLKDNMLFRDAKEKLFETTF